MVEPFTILTICSANVCRSATAEQLLKRALGATKAGDEQSRIQVISAGTHADEGAPMCDRATQWLDVNADHERQERPDPHHATELTTALLERADLILTADRTHRGIAARMYPACRPRLFTMRQAGGIAQYLLTQWDAQTHAIPTEFTDPQRTAGERARWLVTELDAERGARAGSAEEDDDIVDEHGPHDHAATFAQLAEALAPVSRALDLAVSPVNEQ